MAAKKNASRVDPALSSRSSAELRDDVERLLSEEDRLLKATASSLQPEPEVLKAIANLDPGIVEELKVTDGAVVYRSRVTELQEKLAALSKSLDSLRSYRAMRILLCDSPPIVAALFLIVLAPLEACAIYWFLAMALYFAGVTAISPLGLLLISYSVVVVGTLLWQRPKAAEYVDAEIATVATHHAALMRDYEKRQDLARDIKRCDKYLKDSVKRDGYRAELDRVRRDISQCESILKKRTDRSRTAIPGRVRNEVMLRDGGACVKCGSKSLLQFDHIIPYSMGGNDSVENLQITVSNV